MRLESVWGRAPQGMRMIAAIIFCFMTDEGEEITAVCLHFFSLIVSEGIGDVFRISVTIFSYVKVVSSLCDFKHNTVLI